MVISLVQQFPGSNLGQETSYPENFVRIFFTPARNMIQYYVKAGHDNLLLHDFLLTVPALLTFDAVQYMQFGEVIYLFIVYLTRLFQ